MTGCGICNFMHIANEMLDPQLSARGFLSIMQAFIKTPRPLLVWVLIILPISVRPKIVSHIRHDHEWQDVPLESSNVRCRTSP